MDLYLKTERYRYRRGNREVKKRVLDDFCETHGYHRKAAARLVFLHPAYSQCMPKDWFLENPQELVSSAILQEVHNFWHSVDRLPSPSDSEQREPAHE